MKKCSHIKTLVVDDWQYMSSFEYFDRANEKGYDKFTQIAANLAMVAKLPKDLRDDLTVIFLDTLRRFNRYKWKQKNQS